MTDLIRALPDILSSQAEANLSQLLQNQIALGLDGFNDTKVWLPDKARVPLTYIRGKTGAGKSRLMGSMIVQDIFRGTNTGVMLVDPGGGVFDTVLEYAASLKCRLERDFNLPFGYEAVKRELLGRVDEKFNFYQFTSSKHGHTFNPLHVPVALPGEEDTYELEYIVKDWMSCIERLFGSLKETRRLAAIIESFSKVVAAFGGCPNDITTLLGMLIDDSENITSLLEQLENRADAHHHKVPKAARDYIELFLTSLSKKEILTRVESSWNALMQFLQDPAIYNLFDVRPGEEPTINIRKIWREDLCACFHLQQGRGDITTILGKLFVNTLEQEAEQTGIDLDKKFFCFLDEFHLFVGDSKFANATTQVRKFGLRFCIAHQHSGQPPMHDTEGMKSLQTIIGSSRSEIYFNVGIRDAREVASSLVRPTGKQEIERIEEVTRSEGQNSSKTKTKSTSKSSGGSVSTTFTVTEAENWTEQITEQVSKSFANTKGESFSVSDTFGQTQTLTYSEANGISKVHNEAMGLTLSKGEGWSRAESETNGTTITIGNGQTVTNTRGTNHGQTQTESTSHRSGQGIRELEDGDLALNITEGDSHGISTAISTVIQESQSLAQQSSRSKARSQTSALTNTFSGSSNLGQSKTITEGLSKIDTITRGISQGTSRQRGRTKSTSQSSSVTDGQSVATGKATGGSRSEAKAEQSGRSWQSSSSEGTSEQEGSSKSVSRTEKIRHFSTAEEIEQIAWDIAELEDRHAFLKMQVGGGKPQVFKFKVMNVPDRMFDDVELLAEVDVYKSRFLEKDKSERTKVLRESPIALLEIPNDIDVVVDDEEEIEW